MKHRIWVVASAETAARWCAALAREGRDLRPFAWSEIACVRPESLPGAGPEGRPDLLIVTSANAVACLPTGLPPGVPCACVGEETASAARARGLAVALVGPGTGVELAALVLARTPPVRRVLFLRGAEVRREGPDALAQAGIEVLEAVVYEACPRPGFAAEIAGAPLPAAVVVGSPRAAQALLAAWRGAGRGRLLAPVVAIGSTTHEALKAQGVGRVEAADRPDVAGLSAALDRVLCSDPSA